MKYRTLREIQRGGMNLGPVTRESMSEMVDDEQRKIYFDFT